MDEFDLTPEEEEEMRTRFWEIVKKYRSTENDPELTPEPNAFDFENCASHSRYFSDELDAQNFYQNGNKCLSYSYAYGILFL